jgi:hypothetical protein
MQFNEYAADLLDIVFFADHMLVPKQEIESQLSRLHLRFRAGMKRAVFGTQLFGRVASHPESLHVSHPTLAVLARSGAKPNAARNPASCYVQLDFPRVARNFVYSSMFTGLTANPDCPSCKFLQRFAHSPAPASYAHGHLAN